MVARLVRDQEAVGSNPATSTTLDSIELLKRVILSPDFFRFPIYLVFSYHFMTHTN